MSTPPSFEELVERLRAFRDARDWSRFHSPKNLAISVSIEAGELLEIFQWTSDTHRPNAKELASAADEAADVLIYLLLLCDQLGINLRAAAGAKIERNEARFPVARRNDLQTSAGE